MKKIVAIFILFLLPYIAFSQCVAQLTNDTVIKCGTQTSLHLQLPWRSINSNVSSHLNDLFFTNNTDAYIVGANGVILKSTDKGETYISIPSGTTETINSVFFKNSTSGFCVGNNGLILNTFNAGLSWSNVSISGLSNHLKSVFFLNENVGFIVGYNGTLFKTLNGGASWFNIAPTGSSNDNYNAVYFFDSNNGYVVGNNGKFIMTQDGGSNWFIPYTSFTIDLTDIIFVNANKGFVIGSNQIFETTNGGYSWYSYNTYPTLYQDITFHNSQVGFAVGFYGTIMKTVNGGTSWQKEFTCTTNEFMAVSARDSFFMAVGKNGSIAKYEIPQQIVWSPNINIDKSDPYNPTVYPFNNTKYYLNVLFENTPEIYDSVSITLDPFLYSTVNDQSLFCGNSIELSSETEWFPIYNKRIYTYTDQYFISPDTGFVITDDGHILKTTNGAYTWDSIAYFGVSLNSLEFLTPQVAFALGSSSLYKTINSGLSWTQLPISTPATLKSVDFINSNIGFVCGGINDINGSSATILKTTDGGVNWEIKHLTSGYELREIYFVNDTIGFAIGSNGTILRTNNGGELWTSIPNSNIAYLNSIHFTNQNDGYIVGSGVALKTTNGGLNWSSFQGPFNYSYLSSVLFTDSLTGYILGTGTNSVVVFKTSDGGITWASHTVNGISYIPTALSFPSKNTGYLVGNFGSMAKLEIPIETWTPSGFVYQNSNNQYFANPNQTTTMSVSAVNRLGCSASDQVNIQVYPFFANYTHNQTISCGSSVTLDLISHGYTGSAPLNIHWSPNVNISDTLSLSPTVFPYQNQQYLIQISTSNGCHFQDSILVTVNPLIIDVGSNVLINCGESAQLHVSSHWAPVSTMYHYFYDIDFPTEQIGYGVSNGVWKTVNGGYTWEVKFQSDMLRKLQFIDSLHGFAVGYGGLFVKTVDGNNFTFPSYLINTEPRDLQFFNMDTGYVVCDAGKIRKTVNGGTTWINLSSGTSQNLNDVFFVSPRVGYIVGQNGTILKTENYGQQWTLLNCGTTSNIKTVYFLNDTVGFVVSDFHIAYKTVNGGTTWQLLPQTLPSNSICFIDDQIGYAAGTIGATGAIAKTTNGGNTWVVTSYQNFTNFLGLSFPNSNVGYVFGLGIPQNSILKLPTVPDYITWSPSIGLTDTTSINPIANPLQTTTYHVSTLAGYCPAHDSVTVQVIPFEIQGVYFDQTYQICHATVAIDSISTNYSSNQPLIYQWNNSDQISNPTIQNPIINTDSTSWYAVTVSTSNGCVANDSILIFVNPLMIEAGLNHYLLCGETVQMDSITSNYTGSIPLTYLWNPSNGLSDPTSPNPIAMPTNQIYTVTAFLDTICSATDQVGVFFMTMQEPSICIVTVDTNNKNMIVFEKPESNGIDSFYVYRETNMTGSYEKIGSVPYDSFSVFVDQTSSPATNSNQYKISLIDTCGFNSNMSLPHQTMHLTINQGMGSTWNLIWQPYVGFNVNTYNIYRGTTPTQMQLIGTISGANTQYTDLNPPSGYVYYQVEVVAPYSCNPSMKNGFQSSRSNIASNATISIEDFINNKSFNVYPNPSNSVINIDYTVDDQSSKSYSIFNVYGELVNNGNGLRNIDISNLSNGVYFIQIDENGKMLRAKFVVQK